MKNFENFEAFKMSKTQMNEITGGAEVYCTTFNGEKEATFENTSVEDAQAGADAAWGKGKAICEEVIKD